MADKELIISLNKQLSLQLSTDLSDENLKERLIAVINNMIQNDFEKLVSILYRLDVSENKLKFMLKENAGEDAAKIIAALIMEREQQKMKSRRENQQRDNTISDEEKW